MFLEIRNHIYSFTLEPDVIALFPSSGSQSNKSAEESSHVSPADSKSKRVFYTLTQVCRQVRKEFLPLYMIRNTVHIRHYDLGDYVDFLDQIRQHMNGSLSSTDSCLFGNVAVDMYPHPEGNKGDHRTVELLPVIKRCRDAKNLRICCGTNDCKRRMCELDIWAGVEKALNRVFNVKTNAKLAAYLDDAVSALELSFPPYLGFCIYKRYWQEWMGATSLIAQCQLDA